jgi:hypothetical protein
MLTRVFASEECMFFASLTSSQTNGINDANAIRTRVSQTCAGINDVSARAMCNAFIARPEVVPMLASHTSPARMCTRMGDCHARSGSNHVDIAARAHQYVLEHPFRPQITGQSSTECQLCQWIFSAYESWLSDAQTEAEIALFLSQLCNFFGTYAAQCDQLVRVYVPKVIQSYVERTTPPILCTSIGFCQLPLNQLQVQ